MFIPTIKEQSVHIPNQQFQLKETSSFFSQFFQISTMIIFVMAWLLILNVGEGEAKRKRRAAPPPLKILDISTSPMPYVPGPEPLALTIEVELPKNLKEDDLVEVSSFISFPSQRSIRFLFSRHPISSLIEHNGKPRVSTTLLWDGRDQTDQLVVAGTYKYEVRAKLLAKESYGLRTKMVSLRARGTLEVTAPEIMKELDREEPPHVEHMPFASDDLSPEELEMEEEELDQEKTKTALDEDSVAQEAGEPQEGLESEAMPAER